MPKKNDDGIALLDPPAKSYTPAKKGEKRLNLILSSGVYEDLSRMAEEKRTTMTEIVRLALGLTKVAIHEAKLGHKLVVAKENGDVIKELILPG